MLFFTLPKAADAPVVSGGSIFSWGTKFKYTGRTEREVLEEIAASVSGGSAEASSLRGKGDTPVQRSQSTGLRRKASSVPATPSTPSQDLIEIRYSSLPRSCHSAGLDGAGMSDSGSSCPGAGVPLSSPYCPDNTLPLLETVSEDQEIYARRNNGGQSGDADTNDYFFRDSFDHSSSESQHLDAIGKPQSRSVTPIQKSQKLQNTKLYLQASGGKKINDKTKTLRGIRVFRLFISAFILTITILFIIIVLVFETETNLFDSVRKMPEILMIKSHYYVPIKEFLRTKIGLF